MDDRRLEEKIEDVARSLQTFALSQVSAESQLKSVEKTISQLSLRAEITSEIATNVALNTQAISNLVQTWIDHKKNHDDLDRMMKSRTWDVMKTAALIIGGAFFAELARWAFLKGG